MALPDTIARLFLEAADALAPPEARNEAHWLSIGTVDYYVTPRLLSRHGITPPPKRPEESFEQRSKRLMSSFAAALGYGEYSELDVNNRADVLLDLNYPLPDELRGRFDLVWDSGSVEHVMNAYQAVRNAVDLVRPGGIFVSTQGIGDQTNAGYWTISPNFFVDFLETNGFETIAFTLWDRRGHTAPYREITTKTSTTGSLIPARHLPSYYLRTVRKDLVSRWFYGDRIPNRASAVLEMRVPSVARALNAILGRTGTAGPDWGMWVAARKTRQASESLPIQNIYRGSYTLKPRSR